MHKALKQAIDRYTKFEAYAKGLTEAGAAGMILEQAPMSRLPSRIRQDQAGRKAKRPSTSSPKWFGLDIHFEDIGKILRVCNAPEAWLEDIPFLTQCVLNPHYVNPLGVDMTGKTGGPRRAIGALRFAKLYSEAPTCFLKVLGSITRYFDKVANSPEAKVAQLVHASPDASKVKAAHLGAICRVSPKVVEHGREKARKRR